jgi:nucleoside-diphosphate-sugar epimerase
VSHLARLSRFNLDCRIADASDQEALVSALSDCDTVVHAISGSPNAIMEAVEPAYRAAHLANVRRIVYLSSASVHGQSPDPGTTDQSPLSDRQPVPYSNAKVWAERKLQELRKELSPEIVVLRPGIVFGPRSSWIGSFANSLLSGEAWLFADETGICNSLYVDNLVHAIELAVEAQGVDRQAFLLGDNERVTWHDLYRPVAESLGYSLEAVRRIDPVLSPESWKPLQSVASSPTLRRLASPISRRFRKAVWAGLSAFRAYRSPEEPHALPAPRASLEMSLLYTCRYKLGHEKATRLLGYQPPVSFSVGCRRTVGWMEFAGYPVTKRQMPIKRPASGVGET